VFVLSTIVSEHSIVIVKMAWERLDCSFMAVRPVCPKNCFFFYCIMEGLLFELPNSIMRMHWSTLFTKNTQI
jgi:hypothetical protein